MNIKNFNPANIHTASKYVTMTIKSFGKKMYKKNHLYLGSSKWNRGCSESLMRMSFHEEDEDVRDRK